MAATLSTLSNILKELYLPPVVDQLNNEILITSRWESRKQDLVGNEAVIPVHTQRSTGIGARAEGGTLPSAGNQTYDKAVYDLKYLYGRIQVTGPSLAKTKSESGAFLEAYKSELDGIRRDLMLDLARQLYGTGDGKIVTCGTTTSSTTVQLADSEALRKGYLYVGMIVDIGTLASPTTIVSGATISAVSIANSTITIDSSVTTSSSHFVFRSASVAASSVSYETTGLQQIVSTSANTLGGIDASSASKAYWDNLRDTTGGALSLDALMQNWNRVQIAGGNPSVMLTSFGIQRAYFNLLQSQVRYVEPTKIRGGFQSLEFQGMPMVADRLAPFGKLYLLDEEYLKVFSPADWDFLARDGQTVKWVQDKDAFQSILFRYLNIGASRRNVQLVMSGLTDTNGY